MCCEGLYKHTLNGRNNIFFEILAVLSCLDVINMWTFGCTTVGSGTDTLTLE